MFGPLKQHVRLFYS